MWALMLRLMTIMMMMMIAVPWPVRSMASPEITLPWRLPAL